MDGILRETVYKGCPLSQKYKGVTQQAMPRSFIAGNIKITQQKQGVIYKEQLQII